VSRVVTFWLPVVSFNVLLESNALLLNAGIMHASPLTQTRRFNARLPGHLVPRKQAISSVVGQTLGKWPLWRVGRWGCVKGANGRAWSGAFRPDIEADIWCAVWYARGNATVSVCNTYCIVHIGCSAGTSEVRLAVTHFRARWSIWRYWGKSAPLRDSWRRAIHNRSCAWMTQKIKTDTYWTMLLPQRNAMWAPDTCEQTH